MNQTALSLNEKSRPSNKQKKSTVNTDKLLRPVRMHSTLGNVVKEPDMAGRVELDRDSTSRAE